MDTSLLRYDPPRDDPEDRAPRSIIDGNGKPIPVWRQWYMVITLTVLVGIAYIDRGAIMLVVDPIKADLNLSDVQVGLLVGVSLSVFQLLISIPLGLLIDKLNRKYLVMIGVVFWSTTTAACGLATNFAQLFLARMGAGFADGGLAPAAFSLIRDGVAPNKHGRAFGIFGMGLFLGGAMSLVVGGAVVGFAEAHQPMALPIVGAVKPWQLVFLVLGIFSIPFVLLMLLVVEPARGGKSENASSRSNGYGAAIRIIVARRAQFLPLFIFASCFFAAASGFGSWGPALVYRNYGIPLSQVGYKMGLIVAIAPVFGSLIGGTVIDRLSRNGRNEGAATVALCAIALVGIPKFVAPTMPTENLFWISFFSVMVLGSMIGPAIQVMLAQITPSHISGKVMVIYGIVQVIFGASLGPLLIGAASDNLFSGPKALAHAVMLGTAIFVPLGIIAGFWLRHAMRNLPDDAQADHADDLNRADL